VADVGATYEPVSCAGMPTATTVPASLGGFDVRAVLSKCEGALSLVMTDTVWQYERTKTGQVDRTASGTCYANGKLSFKLTWAPPS
jgi:hypothetical protein